MKLVDPEKMRHHLKRSRTFFDAMRLLLDDMDSYGAAVALLAVHTTISLADAVLVALTGKRSNEQDHRAAVKPLKLLCGQERVDDAGIAHLVWLVSRKSDFAYGDKRISGGDMDAARLKAEKFRAWVYRNFKEVVRDEANS